MKAIVPVAGVGSRLRPHTYHLPKVLIPVAGKPIVGHIMDQLLSWGIDHIVFIVGHLREMIEDYLKSHYSQVKLEFRLQERPLGLGHAVLTGLDPEDGEVLILLGDTILAADPRSLFGKGITTLGVSWVENPSRFGVVVEENGQIVKLVEKPTQPISHWALVGLYLIRSGSELNRAIKEVMEQGITVKGEYQLTDALQILLSWGERMEMMEVKGWYDCGKIETLLETQRHLFALKPPQSSPRECENSLIVPPVHLEEGVVIKRAIVGPNVTIGSNSIIENSIVEDSIIGENTHLNGVVVKGSLIGRRVRIHQSPQFFNLGASSEWNG